MKASDFALRIDGVGKRYRIGREQAGGGGMYRYKSLRDSLGGLARRPWSALSALSAGPMTEDNSLWALKDVGFEVERGEVVGIIGRNGAGKSTLLKILSRITKPTVGEIELRGRVGSLLEVGTGFHPELTGRENVYLNGAILGMTRAEVRSKFDEIVAFSEIERFLDTPVKHYSSGMYTRLAFAVAAHLEPEILVVDEVLAVGDAAFQKKCLGKMKDVAGEGRTVLFVSHNMASISELCDRVICLADGAVISDGRADRVIPDYYAATLHATAASAVSLGGGLTLERLALNPPSPRSGERAAAEVSIRADEDRRIDYLHLLVTHQIFGRACMVDLLPGRRTYDLAAGHVWRTRFDFDPLMLVPGTFSLGLHIADDAGARDRLDLRTFDVVGADEAVSRYHITTNGPLLQPTSAHTDDLNGVDQRAGGADGAASPA